MATLTPASLNASKKKKLSFAEGQRLAKRKSYEKQALRKKIKLQELTVFTQQLAAMLEAGLNRLGGDDFDRIIADVLLKDIRDRHGLDLGTHADAMQALRLEAEDGSEILVHGGEASLRPA